MSIDVKNESYYSNSRDYVELFGLLQKGFRIACFVDFNYSSLKDVCAPSRDICTAYEIAGDYVIASRGREYGSVGDLRYFKEFDNDLDRFVHLCSDLNLSFIKSDKTINDDNTK